MSVWAIPVLHWGNNIKNNNDNNGNSNGSNISCRTDKSSSVHSKNVIVAVNYLNMEETVGLLQYRR